MLGYYQQLAARPSYRDFLKILEADIQHANMLWVFPYPLPLRFVPFQLWMDFVLVWVRLCKLQWEVSKFVVFCDFVIRWLWTSLCFMYWCWWKVILKRVCFTENKTNSLCLSGILEQINKYPRGYLSNVFPMPHFAFLFVLWTLLGSTNSWSLGFTGHFACLRKDCNSSFIMLTNMSILLVDCDE